MHLHLLRGISLLLSSLIGNGCTSALGMQLQEFKCEFWLRCCNHSLFFYLFQSNSKLKLVRSLAVCEESSGPFVDGLLESQVGPEGDKFGSVEAQEIHVLLEMIRVLLSRALRSLKNSHKSWLRPSCGAFLSHWHLQPWLRDSILLCFTPGHHPAARELPLGQGRGEIHQRWGGKRRKRQE